MQYPHCYIISNCWVIPFLHIGRGLILNSLRELPVGFPRHLVVVIHTVWLWINTLHVCYLDTHDYYAIPVFRQNPKKRCCFVESAISDRFWHYCIGILAHDFSHFLDIFTHCRCNTTVFRDNTITQRITWFHPTCCRTWSFRFHAQV